jgi:hypothetical protein
MGICRELPVRRNEKAPRHSEVNQQDETAFEPDNYIVATSIDRCDPPALELSGYLAGVEGAREPFVEDLDRLERSVGEDRRQLGSDRLDLGQLGHAR